MLRLCLASAAALIAITSAQAAGCPLAEIETVLNTPLEGMTAIEREVSEVQSTEGGGWQIYKDEKGAVHSIVRGDYGESGRNELRLSVLNGKAYGIARTRLDYIRHALLEGPFAIARRSTDYYFFCDGKVYLPAADTAMVDLEQYPKDAAEAQKAVVGSPDVAEFTTGLAR